HRIGGLPPHLRAGERDQAQHHRRAALCRQRQDRRGRHRRGDGLHGEPRRRGDVSRADQEGGPEMTALRAPCHPERKRGTFGLAKRSLASLGMTGVLLAAAGAAQAADLASSKRAIERSLDGQYTQIDALYKDIHAHPELGFQEARTAAKLAEEMRALGFEVTEGVGKTGIVALYRNGPGPVVMVRTELDALPLAEKT